MSIHTLEQRSGRTPLQRELAITAPFALIALLVLAIPLRSLAQGQLGALLPAGVLGAFTASLALRSMAIWRDLHVQPICTRGTIRRQWSKGSLLFFLRSHYVHVDRTVFAVSPGAWAHINDARERSVEPDPSPMVEVHHWPHSKAVISLHLLEGEHRTLTPDDPPAAPLEVL